MARKFARPAEVRKFSAQSVEPAEKDAMKIYREVPRSGELRAGQGRVVCHHTVSSAPRGTAPRPRSSTRSFIRALCTCDFDVPSEIPSAAPTSR